MTPHHSIAAVAEALFPPNDLGLPDWRETELVPRTCSYISNLPRPARGLLVLLFVVVEWAAPVLAPGLRRFSKRSRSRRLAAIRRWRASRFYLIRQIGDSLKAVLSMMYLSHPKAIVAIGIYKHCENPEDPLRMPIRGLRRNEDGSLPNLSSLRADGHDS